MTKPTYFKPYQKASSDLEYNRLFCEDRSLYRLQPGEFEGEHWQRLMTPRPAASLVHELAGQDDLPARLRILAFNYLLKKGQKPTRQELLGFILEAGEEDGLETLAAYTDYSVVYINSQGETKQWQADQPAIRRQLIDCFTRAAALAERLRPTDLPRFIPPFKGLARITLLLSDGRYFGQGPGHDLGKDPLSGPLIRQANNLLANLVAGDHSQ
jgi:hypothetical protein